MTTSYDLTQMIRIRSKHQLKKYLQRSKQLWVPFRFIATYLIWISFFRLITLSVITYFVASPSSHFQDISDAFRSNEVTLMGISALLFITFHSSLNPLSSFRLFEIFNRETIEKNFLPGFAKGSLIAGALISLLIVAGTHRYLGSFIQLEDAPLELFSILLRMVILIVLTFSEELLFRKFMPDLIGNTVPPLISLNLIAFSFCVIKAIQFDLGANLTLTLFLISVSLSLRTLNKNNTPINSVAAGAGLLSGVLVVCQPLMSLPIFGSDFSGILLVKYQTKSTWINAHASGSFLPLNHYLSGGFGGPLSSLVFQLLLILDIGRSILIRKVLRNVT